MTPHGAQAPAPPRPPSERGAHAPPPPSFASPPPTSQPAKTLLTTSSLNFRRRILRQYSVAPPPEYFAAEHLAWLPHFSRDLADLVLCLEGFTGPSDAAYLESAIRSYIQWAAFVKKIQVSSLELAEELAFIRRLFPRFTKAVDAVARDQEITLPPPVPETIESLLDLPQLEEAAALRLPWRGATPSSPRLEPVPPPPTPRADNTPPVTPADSTFSSPTSRSFEPRPATPQRQERPSIPQRPYHPLPQPPTTTSPRALPPHPPLVVPDSSWALPPPLSPNPTSPKHGRGLTPSPQAAQRVLTPSPRPSQPPVLAPNPRPQQQAAQVPNPRPPQQAPAPNSYGSQNAPALSPPTLRHQLSNTTIAQPQLALSFPTPNTKQPQLQQKSSQLFRVTELAHQLAPPAQCVDEKPPIPPPKNKQRFGADSEARPYHGQGPYPPLQFYHPEASPPQPSNGGTSSTSRPIRPQTTVTTNPNQREQDRRQPYRPPRLVIPSPLGPVHTDNSGWKSSNNGSSWGGSGGSDNGWGSSVPGASSIVPTPVTARKPLSPNPPARPSSDYETVRMRGNVNPELLADRPLSHPSSLQRRGAQHQGGVVARRPSTKPKRTLSVRRGGSRPSPSNMSTGASTPLATYPTRHPPRRATAESTSSEFTSQLTRATFPPIGHGRQEIMTDGPVQGYSEFGALRDSRRQEEPGPRQRSFYENNRANPAGSSRAREPSWVSIDSEEELRPQVRPRPESPYSPINRPLPPHTPSSLPWDRPKRPTSAASWVTVDSVASGAASRSPPPVGGRGPEPWRDHAHTSSQDWIPQPQRARPVSRHSMDQVPTAQAPTSVRRESEPAAPPMAFGFQQQLLRREETGGNRLRRDLSVVSTLSLPPPPPPYGS